MTKKNTVLISGSCAYDHIMVFQDQFKKHILPDHIHQLNVSFLVPQMRREFGGCAANIAYNLTQIGVDAKPLSTVGVDFKPYQQWLEKQGVDDRYIKVLPEQLTGQAFIITDLDDNQITAFHPGAMNESHQNSVADVCLDDVALAMVSPAGREGMLAHAKAFQENNIPFIFDPGQGLILFSGDELQQFIKQATWLSVNDYEWQLLKDKTAWDAQTILAHLKAIIVTKGGQGSTIITKKQTYNIDAVPAKQVLDPTGCGDAYRAGLIFGLMHQLDWQTTGQISAILGAIKVAHLGTQNHSFKRSDIIKYYAQRFQKTLMID